MTDNNYRNTGQSIRSSMSIMDLKGISFKIIVIGDSSIGKTTLIHKYIHGQYLNEYNITVGVDFKSKTVQLNERFVQLQIWDTCGQQLYRSIVSSFYKGACAVFLVYSVQCRKSFENLKFWNESFDKEGSPLAMKFLIGTKSDLQRQVETSQAEQYMKKINGSFCIQTSSLAGQNIDELFQKSAELLYKNYEICPDFKKLVKPNSESFAGYNSVRIGDQQGNQKIKKKKKCC